jgi:hypothetical protein
MSSDSPTLIITNPSSLTFPSSASVHQRYLALCPTEDVLRFPETTELEGRYHTIAFVKQAAPYVAEQWFSAVRRSKGETRPDHNAMAKEVLDYMLTFPFAFWSFTMQDKEKREQVLNGIGKIIRLINEESYHVKTL